MNHRSSESLKKSPIPEEESLNEEPVVELPTPPDGGYGWVIVFASFMCFVIVDGIIFSFGIFLREFNTTFDATKSATAWIASLQSGCYLLIGPVAAALANAFGCRVVTIAGSIIAAVGFILGTFCTSVPQLYLTVGVLGGIGFGFIFLPAAVTISFYFERRRAFATGIAVCGSGIGGFMFAPVCQALIDAFGWRGALLILSGVILNCCFFGALIRPVETPTFDDEPPPQEKPLLLRIKEARDALRKWDSEDESLDDSLLNIRTKRKVSCPPPRILHDVAGSKERCNGSPTGSNNSPPPPYSEAVGNQFNNFQNNNEVFKCLDYKQQPEHRPSIIPSRNRRVTLPAMRPFYRQDILFSASLLRIPEYRSNADISSYHASILRVPKSEPGGKKLCGCFSLEMTDALTQMLDVSLLTSPTFILMSVSGFLTLAGFFVPFMYIVDKAVLDGIPAEKAAFILSIIGITNTVGRVFSGWVSDRPQVNALVINNSALVLGGLTTALCPYLVSYELLLTYSGIFGFSIACFAALRSIIAVEMFGVERLTNAFGLLLLFQGIASMIGSPLAGFFYDITGNYHASFYVAGSLIMLSGIMCVPLPWISRWERKRKEGNIPQFIVTGPQDDTIEPNADSFIETVSEA